MIIWILFLKKKKGWQKDYFGQDFCPWNQNNFELYKINVSTKVDLIFTLK